MQSRDDELEAALMTAIEQYSKNETRILATTIYSTFPREIRDDIYKYYWRQACGICRCRRKLYGKKPWLRPCSELPCSCVTWKLLETFVLPEFVRIEMAKEAAEVFYRGKRHTEYYFPLELKASLIVDIIHLGLRSSDYLQRVWVLISFDNYSHSTRSRSVLKENFHALLSLQIKPNFQLQVWFTEGFTTEHLLWVNDVLRPVNIKLKESGAEWTTIAASVDLEPNYGIPFSGWDKNGVRC
ncbi:hypothetical protein K469DRAFT_690685 [Zopfia rhizophila CBS 207.26]|uniref:Uncharacterized protein n=1 Tax=Zopfia rhizophila CBS 207.26 TaxID=1314779 RepID=A0A6A6DWE8_9PEZI|nr:hypothetical protein K469DRAFT_690685 [Zopfia rhizophila CBS 207.26]